MFASGVVGMEPTNKVPASWVRSVGESTNSKPVESTAPSNKAGLS